MGGWSSATDLGHLSACKRNKKDKKKEAKMQRGDDHKEARSTDTDDDDDEDGHLKALRMSMLEALIEWVFVLLSTDLFSSICRVFTSNKNIYKRSL